MGIFGITEAAEVIITNMYYRNTPKKLKYVRLTTLNNQKKTYSLLHALFVRPPTILQAYD